MEILFAQYKYIKLDSVNYTTVRAKCMCESAVDPRQVHHSWKYYRDMLLFMPNMQLHKTYGQEHNK